MQEMERPVGRWELDLGEIRLEIGLVETMRMPMDDPREIHPRIQTETLVMVVEVSDPRRIHYPPLAKMIHLLDRVGPERMRVKARATKVQSRCVDGRRSSRCRELTAMKVHHRNGLADVLNNLHNEMNQERNRLSETNLEWNHLKVVISGRNRRCEMNHVKDRRGLRVRITTTSRDGTSHESSRHSVMNLA